MIIVLLDEKTSNIDILILSTQNEKNNLTCTIKIILCNLSYRRDY